jgi:hypothetical protein
VSKEADRIVVGLFVIGGSVLGAILGFFLSLGLFSGRRSRSLFGVQFPLELRPALIVIALFTVVSGAFAWRAGRHAVTKQLK